MTTAQERLDAIYNPYSQAYDRRSADMAAATSDAQANQIQANLNRLEAHYLDASTQALNANGQAVEDAYDAAVAAQEKVDKAYTQAKDLAEKIRLVGGVVGKVGDLIDKATGNADAAGAGTAAV